MSHVTRDALRQEFIAEVGGYVDLISERLHSLRDNPDNRDLLRQIYRLFHTIKGSAAQLALPQLSAAARIPEDLLEGVLVEGRSAGAEEILFLEDVVARVGDFSQNEFENAEVGEALLKPILATFRELFGQEDDQRSFEEAYEHICNGGGIVPAPRVFEVEELIEQAFVCVRAMKERLSESGADQETASDLLNRFRRLIFAVETRAEDDGEEVPVLFAEALTSFVDWLLSDFALLGEQAADLLTDYLGYLVLLLKNPGRVEPARTARVIESMQQVRELAGMIDPSGSPDDDDILGLFEETEFILDDEPLAIDEIDFPDSLGEQEHPEPVGLSGRTESPPDYDEDDVDLREIFVAESEAHLQVIGRALIRLDALVKIPQDAQGEVSECLAAMRRAVHTLKGAAAMTGFQTLSGFAHRCEDLLDSFADRTRQIDPHAVRVLGEATDLLELMAANPDRVSDNEVQTLVARIDEFISGLDPALSTDLSVPDAFLAGHDGDEGTVMAPAALSEGEIFAARQGFEKYSSPSLARIEQEALPPHSPEEAAFVLAEEGLPTIDDIDFSDPFEEGISADTVPRSELDSDDDEKDLRDIFAAESEAHLQVIGNALIRLDALVSVPQEVQGEVAARLAEMRRAVHTLKGAAAMVGFQALSGFAHRCEDLFDSFADQTRQIDPQTVQVLGDTVDLLELMVSYPDRVSDEAVDRLVAKIGELILVPDAGLSVDQLMSDALPPQHGGGDDDSVASSGVEADETFAFSEAAPEASPPSSAKMVQPQVPAPAPVAESAHIRVRLENLNELVGLENELIVVRSAMDQRLVDLTMAIDELDFAGEKLKTISHELESGFEVESLLGFGRGVQAVAAGGGKVGETGDFSEFDPIELDRYTRLHLIIRSLNELAVDVGSIYHGLSGLAYEMRGHIANQQMLMRVMQDKLMRVRMTPLSSISRALFRTVRTSAAELGKQVQLSIEGEDVFLDRFIWNKVTDPIMHMLRNAVDHGIENEVERRAAGKSPHGTIRLTAVQRGSHVIMEIGDDGGGIDTEAIRRKLVARGAAERAGEMSEAELFDHLFHPGFTTRDTVSRLSGRGVGLDVVRQNLTELRGSVRVHSSSGQGTTFVLRIPVSLSINRAAIVLIGSEKYAVPLQDILEIRRIPVSAAIGEKPAQVHVGEEILPLKDLGSYFGLRDGFSATFREESEMPVLFVEGEEGRVALVIDGIVEQQEIIVKDLGSHLLHVEGIGGVTIMGDGSLIPILNISELAAPERVTISESAPIDTQATAAPFTVMVVDDSVSVRQSVARLIKHNGWVAALATDGVDAVEKIEKAVPDAIILDIEMPRMNGFEFLGILRSQERFRRIPVIMLTSRFSEKHQKKAEDLGADHYVIKPYKEDQFVVLLQRIAAGVKS